MSNEDEEEGRTQVVLDLEGPRRALRRSAVPPGGIRTKDAIRATKNVHAPTAPAEAPVFVPTIKGKITARLKRANARVETNDEPLRFRDEGAPVVLRTGAERGAVALACLILENLRRLKGAKVSGRELQGTLEVLLRSLTRKEVMDIEVEAYEILLWLGRSLDPDIETTPVRDAAGEVEYDPEQSKLELIQRAIAENFDLEMTYYTGGRAEMTHRRITPHSLEAETYLHAYCHKRKDDRVFRLSRIGEVRPRDGRAVSGYRHAKVYEEEPQEISSQTSLFAILRPSEEE